MPVTVEKIFRFDAGHRALGFHDRKEESLHGHTWVLRLVIEATNDLDAHKTIIDTNELARIVKPIIERFDHAFIVWTEDPLCEQLMEVCKAGHIDDKLIRVEFNPTIEGLAEYFFMLVKERITLRNAVLRRADLDATATLRASYSE